MGCLSNCNGCQNGEKGQLHLCLSLQQILLCTLYYSCQIGSNPIQRYFGYNNEYVISSGTYVLLLRKSLAKESSSLVDDKGQLLFKALFDLDNFS